MKKRTLQVKLKLELAILTRKHCNNSVLHVTKQAYEFGEFHK